MRKLLLIATAILFSSTMFAQTIVSGNVKDAKSGEPLPGVNIKVVGKSLGTSTDFDGNYSLKVDQEPPFDIEITTLGYARQTVSITDANQTADVSLEENATALDEIVVSASRTPESVRESPVTIERMDVRDIQNSSTASFYSSIENLKGVDVNTSSLTFNSVNTRGFATFANTRFVQLVDGMDNSSPVLNFAVGNLLGMNELDVNSVELLPGASSALYGANAFNGILFMTSKNPFDDQGISVYFKKGITSSDAAGNDAYTDFGIRAAKAFSEKFAAKASFSYLKGTDWLANDTNHYDRNAVGDPDTIVTAGDSYNVPITGETIYGSESINTYGDEINLGSLGLNLNSFAQLLEAGGAIPPGASALAPTHNVAFTGYREDQITDYEARSIKTDVALHFRPFENDLELIANYRIGIGNTIYQGANRYNLDNFRMSQLKFELRNDDFFLRAYQTNESSGDSYDMRFTGINLGRRFAQNWFGNYTGAYIQGAAAVAGGGGNPFDPNVQSQLHIAAREFADTNALPQPGSVEYETAFNEIINETDVSIGSKFSDNSSTKVGEGNYNFKKLLNNVIDLQVGGNYRKYNLNSAGTIFTDGTNNGGAIKYDEYGAYIQAVKKFNDDRLKISASLRMDKNEFFDASISPRVSLNYAVGDNKQHNLRASYQTGFRNPDTQALFIGFNVGSAILVGSSPDNLDRILPGTALTGRDAYYDSYSLTSVRAFVASGNPDDLVSVQTDLVEQEKVTAYDIGYRGKLGKVSVDLNAYFNQYDGFINNTLVVTPENGSTSDLSGVLDLAAGDTEVFQLYTNSKADVNAYGGVIGLSTRVGNGYKIGLNYTYAKLDFDQDSDPDFTAGFNTPEHKVKVSFGNANAFKNFGFNINARWSDEFLWQSSIANSFVEDRTVIDAQINYRIPKWKSTFKLGGSNLGGDDYRSAPGAGNVGSLYYVSLTINP